MLMNNSERPGAHRVMMKGQPHKELYENQKMPQRERASEGASSRLVWDVMFFKAIG